MTDEYYDDLPIDDDEEVSEPEIFADYDVGEPQVIDEYEGEDIEEPKRESAYRGDGADPVFGFLLAVAVSVGLTPILPDNADLRYTLAWGALGVVGVLSWLLGSSDRIGQERPDNIAWGVGFGVMISIPFVIFFFSTFGKASHLIFPDFKAGTVLAYLLFVMPLAEALFFRGLLQRRMDMWITGLLGGLWSAILFFPVMWGELLENPAVALFLMIALFTLNLMYSYVKRRNGLAASWLCQMTACFIMFFIPFVGHT